MNNQEKIERYTYTKIYDKNTNQEELFNSIMPSIFSDLYNKSKNNYLILKYIYNLYIIIKEKMPWYLLTESPTPERPTRY